jgi:glutamate-1-semialdehyde aminotransferase
MGAKTISPTSLITGSPAVTALASAGVVAAVLGHPTCFDVLFGVKPKQQGQQGFTPQESIRGDKPTMLRFNELLLERGVHKAYFKYYISCAHSDAEITDAIEAFHRAAVQLSHEQQHQQ